MSNYTTQVRFICESYNGNTESAGYDQINEIIHNVHSRIFGYYPIFDEAYREALETKILKHFYTREICEETVGLWKLRLNSKMNEIMPYYNKLYDSELLKFNPFYDIDYSSNRIGSKEGSENFTGSNTEKRNESRLSDSESKRNVDNEVKKNDLRSNSIDSEENRSTDTSSQNQNETMSNAVSSSTNSGTKNQKDKYSDTPQGGLTGIENDTYLTNARIITDSETDDQNSTQATAANGKTVFSENGTASTSSTTSDTEIYNGSESGNSEENATSSLAENNFLDGSSNRSEERNISNTEDYLEMVRGKRGSGSYSRMLKEFRDTFINIDMMIIKDLEGLFFGLWE